MNFKNIIPILSVFMAGGIFVFTIVYFSTIMPQNKTIRELQAIPKTAITNNYEKIKNNKGLIKAVSAISDTTINKKWWKFGKND